MQDKRKDQSKTLESMANFFIEDQEEQSDIDADLRELGFDPEALAASMNALLKEVDKAEGLAKLQKARQERLAAKRAIAEEIDLPNDRETIVTQIHKVMNEMAGGLKPQLQWRNFERMQTEDLKAVLYSLKQEQNKSHPK